jgi:hypothetical protein
MLFWNQNDGRSEDVQRSWFQESHMLRSRKQPADKSRCLKEFYWSDLWPKSLLNSLSIELNHQAKNL